MAWPSCDHHDLRNHGVIEIKLETLSGIMLQLNLPLVLDSSLLQYEIFELSTITLKLRKQRMLPIFIHSRICSVFIIHVFISLSIFVSAQFMLYLKLLFLSLLVQHFLNVVRFRFSTPFLLYDFSVLIVLGFGSVFGIVVNRFFTHIGVFVVILLTVVEGLLSNIELVVNLFKANVRKYWTSLFFQRFEEVLAVRVDWPIHSRLLGVHGHAREASMDFLRTPSSSAYCKLSNRIAIRAFGMFVFQMGVKRWVRQVGLCTKVTLKISVAHPIFQGAI